MDLFPTFQIDDPPWIRPEAAYIHIPFCAHRCGYCDFAIATGKDERIDAYLAALDVEMRLVGEPKPVKTIFVGGGTPSHLDLGQLEKLCKILKNRLVWSCGAEVSLEANPESLTQEKVRLLKDAGFTRISLGAQSFSRQTLNQLERPHEPAAVCDAVSIVQSSGMAVSVDLIFGAPGQSIEDWAHDLDRAMALGVGHLSTYGLTYEKGTPLEKRVRLGMVRPVDEESERTMYALSMDHLGAAGYRHYEISNFALTGQTCRHNEVYWANEAHWGFGMGASGYVALNRELNTRDLERYIRLCESGKRATFQGETLAPRDRAIETMAQNLRRSTGIDRHRFSLQTGFDLAILLGKEAAQLAKQGLVEWDDAGLRLTRAGRFVGDAVIERLMRFAA